MNVRAARLLLVVLLLVLLVPGGAIVAAFVVKQTEKQRAVRRAFRAAARSAGWSEDFADALTRLESRWNATAANTSGPDGARGGAFGASQMTVATLKSHGATEADVAAIRRGDLAAQTAWTVRLLRARPGGMPATVEDLAAWWNAGRVSWAAVPELSKSGKPFPTRASYLPELRKALAVVKANPLPPEGAA